MDGKISKDVMTVVSKMSLAIKVSAIAFLTAGAVNSMMNGWINWSFAAGARRQCEARLADIGTKTQQYQLRVNQVMGELQGLKNPEVDAILAKLK